MTDTFQQSLQIASEPTVLSTAEAAWLACAIDAEGSVSIIFRNRDQRIGLYVCPRVMVANTNHDFLAEVFDLISRAAGGAHYGKVHNGTNVPVFRVEVASEPRVGAVLREILPYLIIKRDRAKALLAYFEARHIARRQRPSAGGNTPYGDELARLCVVFGKEVP